jgi:hypothetical protein
MYEELTPLLNGAGITKVCQANHCDGELSELKATAFGTQLHFEKANWQVSLLCGVAITSTAYTSQSETDSGWTNRREFRSTPIR